MGDCGRKGAPLFVGRKQGDPQGQGYYNLKDPRMVTSFLQSGLTFQHFQNLPKQCHQLKHHLPTHKATRNSSSSDRDVHSDFPVGIIFLFLTRNFNSLSRWSNVSSQLMQTLHVKLNSPASKEFSVSFQCKSQQHNCLLEGNRSLVDFLCSFSCPLFLITVRPVLFTFMKAYTQTTFVAMTWLIIVSLII